jgi:hypothetical protein
MTSYEGRGFHHLLFVQVTLPHLPVASSSSDHELDSRFSSPLKSFSAEGIILVSLLLSLFIMIYLIFFFSGFFFFFYISRINIFLFFDCFLFLVSSSSIVSFFVFFVSLFILM